MTQPLGHSVLSVFDVWEDCRDFLSQIIESDAAPAHETRQLFHQSLTGGAEDWHYLVDCARSLQQARRHDERSLEGRDILTYVWLMFDGSYLAEPSQCLSEPWEETDRLIDLARYLENDTGVGKTSSAAGKPARTSRTSSTSTKQRRDVDVSHYWSNEPPTKSRADHEVPLGIPACYGYSLPPCGPEKRYQELHKAKSVGITNSRSNIGQSIGKPHSDPQSPGSLVVQREAPSALRPVSWEPAVGVRQSGTSPYFAAPEESRKKPLKAPGGTVSCVPFPPLTSPSFGIVQERLAHEPFWLLVAITFLIRTNGKQALPVFDMIKARFATPLDFIDAANEDELVGMIRHLGLSGVRLAYLRRYAHAFMHKPPTPGIRYKVKNYDRRDTMTLSKAASNSREDDDSASARAAGDGEDPEAWEIGHMTQGKYAIDSWRIFCRDELLGRALDWNGGGREAEFQPEWMRVRPDDKELRAYLRWMWMREGWEWEPATGERSVLRGEMQRAVNERRVEYDETGGLRILGEDRGA